MTKRNITIVGAGNSGMAHAFYLSGLGHNVSVLKTSNSMHDENFDTVCRQGGVVGIDETAPSPERVFAPLKCVTRDVEKALANAEIVFVLTQTLQHQTVAEKIGPYLKSVKALLVVPGNMGSVFFRPFMPKDAFLAEGESSIVDARIIEPGVVQIVFKNVRNALSFNPASLADRGFEFISEAIPNYTHLRNNIVETAMHNPNLVVHTIGTIMSASRIEYSGGDFWLYREGFTPAIWNIIDGLDKEKNNVIEAFGGTPCSYVESCKFRNEDDLSKDAMEVFRSYSLCAPKGPSSIHNRYLLEDVPNGLCLLASLGELAGVATPVADALISLSGLMLQQDWTAVSRTARRLGFTSKDALLSYLNNA